MTVATMSEFTERFEARLGRARPVAAAALVEARPGGGFHTELAHVGPGSEGDFEIGSISKGVTGLLYADAMDRGEVSPDARLADLLPLEGTAVGDLTLASIAIHESGLPRTPPGINSWGRNWDYLRHGANPWREDLPGLLDQARRTTLKSRRHRYSNLGFELLGHAVAAAANLPYAVLLRSRLAEPLGLDPFYVPQTPDELSPGAVAGRSRLGGERDAWTGEAIGPAGGIRASAASMARFTEALLSGEAPGARALDSVVRVNRSAQMGLAWHIMEVHGRDLTWHNGGTGGFRAWIGLDRGAGRGVVVLCASAAFVDPIGIGLLVPRR